MEPTALPDHLLFIFLDGVGLGAPNPEANPFSSFQLPSFAALAGGQAWTSAMAPCNKHGHVVRGLDATLGVEGLPQSGTGQATLFTGVNCARTVGRHFGPYPHSKTKPALTQSNLFSQVKTLLPEEAAPAAFANAYPPRFFSFARRRNRWTVTTHCCVEADITIRSTDHLREDRALAADITRDGWRSIDIDVPRVSEAEAAEHLVALARRHRVTLFEYYLTDKAGHARSMERAGRVLRSLDAFLGALLDQWRPRNDLLILTSDHGNLEDLSTKSHTRNPVPFIALGPGAQVFSEIDDLTDVTPAILASLDRG